MDVFYHSASCGGGFDMKAIGGSFGNQARCQYMPDGTGGFASKRQHTRSSPRDAVPDHHVFGRPVHAEPVPVAAGLQAEIVIIAINIAVLNQYPGGGIDVNAIGAGAMSVLVVPDRHPVNGYMVGLKQL